MGADAGLVAFLEPAGTVDILPTETEVSEAENGASQQAPSTGTGRGLFVYRQTDGQSVRHSAHTDP